MCVRNRWSPIQISLGLAFELHILYKSDNLLNYEIAYRRCDKRDSVQFKKNWENYATSLYAGFSFCLCVCVSLYIRHDIPFSVRHDVDYFDWNGVHHIVIRLIYRFFYVSVDIFNERVTDILNITGRGGWGGGIIYLIRDLNSDLLKREPNKPTPTVLDALYAHIVFLLISKPTRITENRVILIDHA